MSFFLLDSSLEGAAEIDTTSRLFLASHRRCQCRGPTDARCLAIPSRLPVKIIAGAVAINGNAEQGNHRSRGGIVLSKSVKAVTRRQNDRLLANCIPLCPPLSCLSVSSQSLLFLPPSLRLSLSLSLRCRLPFIVLFSVATLSPLNCLDNCVTALAFMRFFIAFHGRWSSSWKGEQPTNRHF